ncbi:MAG: FKBP-type peptidyl-prolyl cis-trans isomerase [Verrucomicrobiota bacterium]|nr:FKBP-type peptidyl-prolyl cis-trans isomerase [Verrucomicrobiota bacterium]
MKRLLVPLTIGFALAVSASGQADKAKTTKATAKKEAAPAKPKETTEHKDMKIVSYLIGADIGSNMKNAELAIEVERFVEGFKAAIAGKKIDFSDDDKNRILQAFSKDRSELAQKKSQLKAFGLKTMKEWDELSAKNKADGKKFLLANGKKKGVKTLPSGLQYEILKAADGAIPKPTDRIKARYKGTLIDGTVFDETTGTTPRQFSVRGVIKGWTEALQIMPVGSKWRLFIPSDLAYGEMGRRAPIGPNSTLIFEMELVEITAAPSRIPSIRPGKKVGSTNPSGSKPRKPITATTPPVAVEFPKEKGGKIKVTPVDPKTGKATGETKLIEPKTGTTKKPKSSKK